MLIYMLGLASSNKFTSTATFCWKFCIFCQLLVVMCPDPTPLRVECRAVCLPSPIDSRFDSRAAPAFPPINIQNYK
jgi:hypothetical protein